MPTNTPSDDAQQISYSRVALFFALALFGCVVDLWTKHWVFSRDDMFHGSEWWLWEGHVGIQKSLNEGALFGLGQGRVWLFALFSFAALIAIPVWLFRYRGAEDRWLTIALGCVTGGILGNLYDRLGLPGMHWGRFDPRRVDEPVYAVRDWILWQWDAQWVWPNFNIADALLVCGAGLLLVQSLFFSHGTLSNPTHPSQATN
ncbi:MAG: signal peptidase II [Pirellulales bacterium]|nr:signal peptidase II [Pirellulales bacterium]